MQLLNEGEATMGQSGTDWKVVFRGAALGVLRALLGTILCVILYFAWGMSMCPSEFERPVYCDGPEFEETVWMLLAVTFYTFLCGTLVPSMLGGGVLSWILLALERSHELDLLVSVVIGGFIGCAAGLAAVILSKAEASFSFLWPLIVIAAVFVGVWHSWRMTRWLQRTQSQSKGQTISEG
jgi:hypothetical protein